MQLSTELQKQFATPIPLFLTSDTAALKLEIKPYLQPFEQILALRELQALIGSSGHIAEKFGYYLAHTDLSESVARERLTFWQRVGRSELVPTLQKTLEFTQSGIDARARTDTLHNARRLRYGPHDIHEYRGKFFPQLVRSLITISGISEEALVLDPMAGSGTTACETLASGRSALAIDLNPLSVLITRVKAGVVLESGEDFRHSVSSYLARFDFSSTEPKKIWPGRELEYLTRWFALVAIDDIAAIVAAIRTVRKPLYRDYFSVCLSNIIRSVSWQKEADLRVRKEVRPYKKGEAIEKFLGEAQEQLHRIYPYLSILPRRNSSPHLEVHHGDVLDVADKLRAYRHKVDLIITSPPYATALPYIDTDRLSLVALGLLRRADQSDIETRMIGTREISERERADQWNTYLAQRNELPGSITKLIDQIGKHNHEEGVGFRRRNLPALLGRYFLAMRHAMTSARTFMKPGAKAYYVVGNNSSLVNGEKIEIPTDRFLFELAETAGWSADEFIPMELLASRDIFRENRGSAETILCFTAK